MVDFKWYNPSVGVASISIAKYGITIPINTVKIMGCPEFIKLGYNKDNSTIAIKACDENDTNKISFSTKKQLKYIRINVKDFVRILNKDFENEFVKAEKFIANWDSNENILTVNLSNRKK